MREGEPMVLQSSVVRLADGESLVIINPSAYNQELQESINALGTVKWIITPTGPHGAALAKAHQIW